MAWVPTGLRLWCCTWAVATAACSFDSSSATGGSGDLDEGDTTGTGAEMTSGDAATLSSTGGPSSATTSDSSSDPTGDPTSDSDTTNGPGPTTTATGSTSMVDPGASVLEISDGPTFDFAIVQVGQVDDHDFTVTNTGEDTATGITVVDPMSPYAVQSSDCGPSLEVNASCTVTVRFAPDQLGPVAAELRVDHDEGMATRALEGGGGGTTDNALVNPGGETPSMPPEGWTLVVQNGWRTTTRFSISGSRSIVAGSAEDGLSALEQIVDVSAWAGVIDSEGMHVTLEGDMRSWDTGNDEYRLRMEFLDDSDVVINGTSQATALSSSNDWVHETLQRATEPGTRSVRVQLECEKSVGNDADCYFEDLDLRLSYP